MWLCCMRRLNGKYSFLISCSHLDSVTAPTTSLIKKGKSSRFMFEEDQHQCKEGNLMVCFLSSFYLPTLQSLFSICLFCPWSMGILSYGKNKNGEKSWIYWNTVQKIKYSIIRHSLKLWRVTLMPEFLSTGAWKNNSLCSQSACISPGLWDDVSQLIQPWQDSYWYK